MGNIRCIWAANYSVRVKTIFLSRRIGPDNYGRTGIFAVIDLRSRIRSLWQRSKGRRPAPMRRAADGGLVYSEAIDSRKLHSAWIGERGSVVTEGRGHIPLVLHRESVKAGIVEHIKYAPTQFK